MMVDHGEKAGFNVPAPLSLRNHYIKTLGVWAANLEHAKDKAIEIAGQENYDRYMKYLTGCQFYFLDECLDVSLVTYTKQKEAA
jgi:cyclopropane-fatty-acyl-phospholipid synthase